MAVRPDGSRPKVAPWQIALLNAVFTLSLGLPGVIFFGPSPPLVLLVTGAAGLIVLTLAKRESPKP